MSQLFNKGKTTLLGLVTSNEQDFNKYEPLENSTIEKSGFDGTLECLYEHWRI